MGGSAGPEDPATFARILRRHRVVRGLTQAALAEGAGVSTRGIQHLEAGLGQPQSETTQRLADALGLHGEARATFERAGSPTPRENQLNLRTASSTSLPPQHNLPRSVTSFLGRSRE